MAAAAAIAWLIWRLRTSGFHWRAFTADMLQLDGRWLAGALVCILLTYLGRAIRWRVLLSPLVPQARSTGLLGPTAIGFTAALIFGRAGELVRPYLIARKFNIPFTSQVAAWLVERVYDLLLVLVLFGYALASLGHSHASVGPRFAVWLEAGGSVVAFLAVLSIAVLLLGQRVACRIHAVVLPWFGFLPDLVYLQLDRTALAFIEGLGVTRHWRGVLLLTLYTVLEWLLVALCYYCLFRSFPFTSRMDAVDILLFLGCVAFGSIVQIPGVGGGMQIVSVVVLTELFRFPIEQATSLALLIWAVTFLVIIPFGLWAAVHEGVSWRKLRHLERAPIT